MMGDRTATLGPVHNVLATTENKVLRGRHREEEQRKKKAKRLKEEPKSVVDMGGPAPFLPMEKCVFFPFSPWGKMGKKVYGKRGESFHFPLFPYTFFPFFPMGKNGKTHIFPWAKMGLDPPYLLRFSALGGWTPQI